MAFPKVRHTIKPRPLFQEIELQQPHTKETMFCFSSEMAEKQISAENETHTYM